MQIGRTFRQKNSARLYRSVNTDPTLDPNNIKTSDLRNQRPTHDAVVQRCRNSLFSLLPADANAASLGCCARRRLMPPGPPPSPHAEESGGKPAFFRSIIASLSRETTRSSSRAPTPEAALKNLIPATHSRADMGTRYLRRSVAFGIFVFGIAKAATKVVDSDEGSSPLSGGGGYGSATII